MIKSLFVSRYRLTVRTQDSQSCNRGPIPRSGTTLNSFYEYMVFDISQSHNKKIEKFYKEAMESLGEFYEINWNVGTPLILLLKSREDIDRIKGRKTEDWVVGFTDGSKKCLFLLSPDMYEKESSHRYSDEEYSALIKHELSHLYSRILYEGYIPTWLVEGIAIYSSGQLALKSKPKELKNFLGFFDKGGSGLYDESGFAVEVLIKQFGKEKFFNFYKGLRKVKSEEDLKSLFKKNYGEDLDYKFFIKYI